MLKRVFVTHHKTGHHLCSEIAQAVSNELGLVYYDLSTASEIPTDAEVIVYESSGVEDQSRKYTFASGKGVLKIDELNFKGVHVVRHPYEIIASAYRWHQKIDRPWLHIEWKSTGKSYKEHLCSGDGVSFEMRNRSRGVLMHIYKFPFSDERFLNVKLEEFESSYDATIMQMARHLNIPEEVMLRTSAPFDLNRMQDYPPYVTRKKLGERSHIALFEPHHYALFREIFPPDILSRFGYDS